MGGREVVRWRSPRRRRCGRIARWFDTHAVARSLTAAKFTPAQADALTDALRLVAEQGDHVTSYQFKAGQAEMRAEIAEVRTEIANIAADMKSDLKLLKFGYGPVVLGFLIKLVFFP